MSTPPDRIGEHLSVLHELEPRQVRITARYLFDVKVVEYTVFAPERITSGPFRRIAGVLAARRFQVNSAQIVTLSDGWILDTFTGSDMDYNGAPPPERTAEIAATIEAVLLGKRNVEQLVADGPEVRRAVPAAASIPPQVEVDNTALDGFTIVDVFADDRQGRLYRIARTLFEEGLSVCSAKISTRIDQIVDAFYVQTSDGGKLTDQDAIRRLRERLIGELSND